MKNLHTQPCCCGHLFPSLSEWLEIIGVLDSNDRNCSNAKNWATTGKVRVSSDGSGQDQRQMCRVYSVYSGK